MLSIAIDISIALGDIIKLDLVVNETWHRSMNCLFT